MTDIKRHLPAALKLIRRALAGLDGEPGGPAPAEALARLRAGLAAALPASYLVADGPVRLPGGGWSLPLDLVLYDRTLLRATGAGEPGAEHALAAFRIGLWPGAAELAADLAAISSLKAPAASRPGRPLGLVIARGLAPAAPPDGAACLELLRRLAAGLPPAGWPDDLWLIDQGWRWRPPRAMPGGAADASAEGGFPRGLSRQPDLRKPGCCYVCKIRFQRRHFWYDQLCQDCGDANYARREQRADLSGMTALVTGGRINIGYETVLRLLRNGASVIATTRFPRDAARRFAAEPDSARWLGRLRLRGLDLRFLPEVERFAAELRADAPRLDILVNNAAQTVRQPAAYYAPLLAGELGPGGVPGAPALPGGNGDSPHAAPAAHPAALAPIPPPAGYLAALARELAAQAEPPANGWTLTLDELPLSELVEAQVVNALAPAVLIQQLKPLLLKGRPSFIINVAAAEGQFARAKRPYHPHTNMAKAALNMLTHTAAADYAAAGVFMNSVDPGWVSLQAPGDSAQAAPPAAGMPIDLADAAARICAPIFDGLLGGAPAAGKLFKDYAEAPW